MNEREERADLGQPTPEPIPAGPECVANAHLIAAGRTLLAALEDIAAASESRDPLGYDFHRYARQVAREAIKKARAEEEGR